MLREFDGLSMFLLGQPLPKIIEGSIFTVSLFLKLRNFLPVQSKDAMKKSMTSIVCSSILPFFFEGTLKGSGSVLSFHNPFSVLKTLLNKLVCLYPNKGTIIFELLHSRR